MMTKAWRMENKACNFFSHFVFQTFAIGIGDQTNQTELAIIASDPDSEYLIQLSGFDAINTLKSMITERICTGKSMTA